MKTLSTRLTPKQREERLLRERAETRERTRFYRERCRIKGRPTARDLADSLLAEFLLIAPDDADLWPLTQRWIARLTYAGFTRAEVSKKAKSLRQRVLWLNTN